MDSVTQIVLGASVGEAVLGKKIGNKAALWGAVAGTIPDLDVLASPFLDTVGELTFHRSVTHSILFCVLASPFFAWLLHKWYSRTTKFKDWVWLFFLGFFTHTLLDTCTTWGTQLLYPFSHYGFATYSVFVVDPFYTIPFMALLIAAMCYPKISNKRRWLNTLGLFVSTAYLGLGFFNQQIADKVFERALQAQGIQSERHITKATPLNAFLWTATAETPDGYYTGFYSIFDKSQAVDFLYAPKNHTLLSTLEMTPKLQRLLEVTKGYYTVEKEGSDTYLINDLRFGQFDGWKGKAEGKFVFTYAVSEQDGQQTFEQRQYRFKPDMAYMKAFFSRVMGNPTEALSYQMK
ncbi:metal-dependent hydrolase [Limibacter armeniacum]|uniref:metal-dependent hydrolase n=1 Tax=Limibacter armeniacum TaxID=466084 RepID=UPI002FE51071